MDSDQVVDRRPSAADYQDFAITGLQEARELADNEVDADRWATVRAVQAMGPEARELASNRADAERWADIRAVQDYLATRSREISEMENNRADAEHWARLRAVQEHLVTRSPEISELEGNRADAQHWATGRWLQSPGGREVQVAALSKRETQRDAAGKALYDAILTNKLRDYNRVSFPATPEIIEKIHRNAAEEYLARMDRAKQRYLETKEGFDKEQSLILVPGFEAEGSYALAGQGIQSGKDLLNTGLVRVTGDYVPSGSILKDAFGMAGNIMAQHLPGQSVLLEQILPPAVSAGVGVTNALVGAGNYSDRELEGMSDAAYLTGQGFVNRDGTPIAHTDFVQPDALHEAYSELQLLTPVDALFEIAPVLGELETLQEISSPWVPPREKWIYGGLETLGAVWPSRPGVAAKQAEYQANMARYQQQARAEVVTNPAAYQDLARTGEAQAPVAVVHDLNWWTDPGQAFHSAKLGDLVAQLQSSSPAVRYQAAAQLQAITGQRPPIPPGLMPRLERAMDAARGTIPNRATIMAALAAPVAGLGAPAFAPLLTPRRATPAVQPVVQDPPVIGVDGGSGMGLRDRMSVLDLQRATRGAVQISVPQTPSLSLPPVAAQPQTIANVLAQPGVVTQTQPAAAPETVVKTQLQPGLAPGIGISTRAQPRPEPITAPTVPHPDVTTQPSVVPAEPVVIDPRVIDETGPVVIVPPRLVTMPGTVQLPEVIGYSHTGAQPEIADQPTQAAMPPVGTRVNQAAHPRGRKAVNRRGSRGRRKMFFDGGPHAAAREVFQLPNRHPAKVRWQEHDVVHTVDLHTGSQTSVEALVPTDAPVHETFHVSEWMERPAPVRIIDLPGAYEVVIGPSGTHLQRDRRRSRPAIGRGRVI